MVAAFALDAFADSVRQTYLDTNQSLAELQAKLIGAEQASLENTQPDFHINLPRSDGLGSERISIPFKLFQRNLHYFLQDMVLQLPCFAIQINGLLENTPPRLALCLNRPYPPRPLKRRAKTQLPYQVFLFIRHKHPQPHLYFRRTPGVYTALPEVTGQELEEDNLVFTLSPQQEQRLRHIQMQATHRAHKEKTA